MALLKTKTITCSLAGFGVGLDGDVEYVSIGLPDTKEDESTEVITNKATYTETEEKGGFDTWSKLEVFTDSTLGAYSAAIAARQGGSTGTITLITGTNTIFGPATAKISKVEGGEADASGYFTSFTPTFEFLGNDVAE